MPLAGHVSLAALALHAAACFLDATGQPLGGGSEQGGASQTTQSSTGASMGGGGAGAAGGSSSDGGGGSTTTGAGGGYCGNGELEPGEQCDDMRNDQPFDGCDMDCLIIAADECASVTPIELAPGDVVQLAGDTTDAGNDIAFSGGAAIAGLVCESDGPDIWYAVHAQSAGAVLLTLTAGPGGDWGGSREKARLELRSGCDAADAGQALVCKPTSIEDDGVATLRLFAEADEVLFIVVDGKDVDSGGPFTLTIEQFECGDAVTQPPEQCDTGAPTNTCQGCLSNSCGIDDADTISVFLPNNKHCYVHEFSTPMNFFEARSACIEQGGDLASLSSVAEKTAIDGLLPLSGGAWVGLEDFEQDMPWSYDWLDGVPFSTPFAPGNPDHTEDAPHCAFMINSGSIGNWADDDACDNDNPGFVCELAGANP